MRAANATILCLIICQGLLFHWGLAAPLANSPGNAAASPTTRGIAATNAIPSTNGIFVRETPAFAPKPLLPAADIPEYFALVIGINKYKHWHELKWARSDAENLAQMLRRSYGFKKVITLLDEQATKANIQDMLHSFGKFGTNRLSDKDALEVLNR